MSALAQVSTAITPMLSLTDFDFGLDRIVLGLFSGLTYGLLAIGLVLVYRSSRFVNFAHGAVGAFGASVLALFVVNWGTPYWLSFLLAIGIAGLLSAGIEVLVVRRLTGRPALIGMIATLGLSQFILIMALVINTDGISGFTFPKPPYLPTWEVDSLPIGPPYIAMFILGPLLLWGLAAFLRRHRLGMAIRAAADDPDAAQLEGIPARRMATLVWGLAGGMAATSAILVTPTTSGQGLDGLGADLLLKGLAGAVIGRMTSIPIAVAASLGIGVFEQLLLSNPDTRSLVNVAIGLVIVIALLRQPILGRASKERGGWRRVVVPPLPEAYRSVRSIVWLPRVVMCMVAMAVFGLAYVVSNETASILTSVGYTLVGLSVGLVTGVSGQLSLGQFAYAGIAAAASAHVVDATGSFVFGIVAGVRLRGDRLGADRHPGDAAQGARARGVDAGLRPGDDLVAAAHRPVPGRRGVPGQPDGLRLPGDLRGRLLPLRAADARDRHLVHQQPAAQRLRAQPAGAARQRGGRASIAPSRRGCASSSCTPPRASSPVSAAW